MGYDKIPRQKLSITKKNKEWREACVEAYVDLSNSGSAFSKRRTELRDLYDYYNGIIDDADYNYVLKPYGKSRKNFPSQMRNYPIIKPIIDLLLGEKSKRPLNYTVTVQNSDSVSIKENAKSELIFKNLQQHFMQSVQNQGQEMGVDPEQEIELPKHVADMFESSYVDNRAILGQKSLNYIMQEQEVYDKIQKGWFHYLVSGEVYTHRGVRSSEPFYDILNPIDVDYDLDPDLEFVEDGDWALVRKYSHASTIIDHYYESLTEDQVLELEEPRHSETGGSYLNAQSPSNDSNSNRSRLLEVVNVYWKSRKRIGFLTYMDPETGVMEEDEVEDGFRLPQQLKEEGASVEWKWVNEVWEGTRIDGRIYIDINPISNQRTSLDNPSKCKLPINGRRYSDTNSKNISLVKLGIPYQLNYNIYKYRLEVAVAKSKDIIAQFDINMIPKKWDMDKFMYFVDATGIAWVDYNKEGVKLSPQHQSVLDMSIKTISQYIELLNSIAIEWEKISGVSRQRQGEIGAYEGKASSQQAILQSSHITEDLFRKFERLEQRDFQALLDYSKEAWLSGKKTMYAMPDGTTDYLDIDSMGHLESNYGIFVSDAGKDQEKLQNIKGLTQAMMQNGTKPAAIAEMLDSDSFSEIKKNLKLADKASEELEAAQQQAQQEMQQQQMEAEQMKAQAESLDKEKDRQKDIEIALINAESKNNPEGTSLALEKMMKDFDIKERELDLKTAEFEEKIRGSMEKESLDRDSNTVKREGDQIKQQIAKENANKRN
jgi:hypothetical protein|tara:strand:- start:3145 stop:5451 length:2307 start_codon:yes stop_codon:yes gene_type:complete